MTIRNNPVTAVLALLLCIFPLLTSADAQVWKDAGKFPVDGGQIRQVAVGDIDGDHVPDVLYVDNHDLWWVRGDKQNLLVGGASVLQRSVYGVVAGQFKNANATGVVFLGQTEENSLHLYMLAGVYSDSTPAVIASDITLTADSLLRVGDFNGDGVDDLLIVSPSGEKAFIGINDGAGNFSFSPLSLPQVGTLWGISIGDFNGDGYADIQTSFSSPTGDFKNFVMWGSAAGSYSVQPLQLGGADFVAAGDLDGNGYADVLVARAGTIHALYSDGSSKTFTSSRDVALDAYCTIRSVNVAPLEGTPFNVRSRDIVIGEDCGGNPQLQVFRNIAATKMSLALQPQTSKAKYLMSVTAKVSALFADGTPQGSVTFGVDGHYSKSIPLIDGSASIEIQLTKRTHRIVAVYTSSNQMGTSAMKVNVDLSHTENQPGPGPLRDSPFLSWLKRPERTPRHDAIYDLKDNKATLLRTSVVYSTPSWSSLSASPTSMNYGTSFTVSATLSPTIVTYRCAPSGSAPSGIQGWDGCPNNIDPSGTIYVLVDGVQFGTATAQIAGNDISEPNCGGFDPNTGFDTNYCDQTSYLQVTFTTTSLPPGTHLISFEYVSDGTVYSDQRGDASPEDDAYGNVTSSTTGTITVAGKLSPSLSVSCSPNPATYGATVSCTSSLSGGSSPTGSISWTINGGGWTTTGINGGASIVLGAGTNIIAVSYGGDGNNNGASGSTSVRVDKATPTVSVSCSPNPITYGPQTSTCTATVSGGATGTVSFQDNGSTWSAPTLSGGQASAFGFNFDGAGNHTVTAIYSGDGNHNGAAGAYTLTINKATPTITWGNPAAITYGTALSGTQLNATASVGGTFSYSPAAGTILGAGSQTLSVTFTPNDTTDYNTASASVSLTVNKATPTITWANPAAITYGTALSPTQLDATASVGGSLVYSPAAGTVLHAGSNTLSVTFTPTDSADYTGASASVFLMVNKATPTLSLNASPVLAAVGTPISIQTFTNCSSSCGSVLFSSPVQTFTAAPLDGSGNYNTTLTLAAGSYSLTATLQPDADHNAVSSSVPVNIYVPNALLSLTATPPSANYGDSVALTAQVSTSGLDSSADVNFYNNTTTNLGAGSVASIASTNLIPMSGLIGQNSWSHICGVQNLVTNSSDFLAPDGSQTAAKFTMPANIATCTTNNEGVSANIIGGLQLGQSYVVSVWLRGAVGGEVVLLGANDDAATSAILTTSWQRFSFPFTATSDIVAGGEGFEVKGIVGNNVFYAWGAQVEAVTDSTVTTPGPYVATGTTSRTASGLLATLSTTSLPVGTDTITAQFSGDTNVGVGTSNVVKVTIGKESPTITWAKPAAITYGTALSATQLNATADVAGSFVYSPTDGTVLAAGTQTLTAVFTPTDSTDYTVQTATVSLTVNKATPKITWANPTAITYGTALSTTQLDATADVAGSFTYSPAAGTVLGAGTQTLSVTFTPTDTADYNSITTTVSLMVNKATPTITWANPTAITYGTALSTTQLDATADVAGSFTYSPAAGTVLGAGTQTLSVSFTPTDTADYNTASATVSLTVNKATPTITWAKPAAITYGTALSTTQLDATADVAGSLTYSPAAGTVLGAGTQTLSVNFTPTDTADYNTASATVSLTVNKATPTITWANPTAITYGTALSTTQLDATADVAGSFTYSPAAGTVLGAGTQTLSVSFTPTDTADYNTASATVSLTVNKATPTITWANPAAITYGTALSATQLDATASTAGSFTYSPAAGAVLNFGTHTLSVTFTPTNTADYNTASASVSLTVKKATPTITWANPTAITYGTALSPTQLDAMASIPGSFTYSPAIGTVLNAGAQNLTATFTPTDTDDYLPQTVTVQLIVNKATPTITWANPTAITYGMALSATQLDATASVGGSFAYSPAAGTVLGAGTQTLSVSFTPTDHGNYTTATASVPLTVNRASRAVTVAVTSNQNPAVFGAGITFSVAVTSSVGVTPTGSVLLNAGAQQLGTINLDTTGKGTLQVPSLPAGSYNIVATYSGDKNYQ